MVVNSSVIIALAEIGLTSIMTSLAAEVIIPHVVYEGVAVRGRGSQARES